MNELFPAVWGSQMGKVGESAYRTWYASLSDLKPGQIKRGLARLVDSGAKFPPSAPEFKAMCRGSAEDLGLPPVFMAFQEATEWAGRTREHAWSHAAVYVAAKNTGLFDLRTKPANSIFKRFEYFYKLACDQVADGEDLSDEMPEALPAPEDGKPINKQAARRHMDQLREMVKR
jgi:hypothetical protein